MGLDVYLAGLSESELEKIQKHLKPSKRTVPPLLCWDICYSHYQEMLNKAKINCDLKALQKYSRKLNWRFDFDKSLNAFPYEALVLTSETKTFYGLTTGFTK